MLRKNIHDPLFEPEICAWESASGVFTLDQVSDLCNQIETEDRLNRSTLAKNILARLKAEDCPPALGIYGGWGTGKTSLLNLLKLLNGVDLQAPTLHIERIDAWKYESAGNLFVPVAVRLKQLAGNKIEALSTFQEDVKRFVAITGLTLTHGLAGFLGSPTPKDVKEYVDLMSDPVLSGLFQMADEIAKVSQSFQNLVNLARENQKVDQLVFCIDNLDRCAPENVVGLLESVKNFVGVENCVWVFAMDSGVVASYINRKYAGTSMDGNSYLDKIIPEQVHLSLIVDQFGTEIRPLLQQAARRTSRRAGTRARRRRCPPRRPGTRARARTRCWCPGG